MHSILEVKSLFLFFPNEKCLRSGKPPRVKERGMAGGDGRRLRRELLERSH